ncbi:MAG: transglutaminase-like domain-containing protein, partial [Jatrophihabitans sp.]
MGTRRVHVGCEFTFVAEIATPTVFQVEPSTDERVDIADAAWRTTPQLNTRTYSDVYGNPCTRLILPPGTSTVGYSALATVPAEAEPVDESAPEIAAEDLPDEVLLYTLPSRYCLPDVLGDHAWAQFGSLPRGYIRVQAVVDYVNHYLRFEYGTSLATSSAVDVFQSGVGVCRDFAHLAIS